MAGLVPDPARTGDVIVAPATAPGPAAVAIVRLSGPPGQTIAVARRLVPGLPSSPRPRHAYLRPLSDGGGEVLDEGIVLVFPAPRSVTGEEVVELFPHGSPAIVEALVAGAVQAGARRAGPGEFTRRALESGRLDLARAEGVAVLVTAASRREVRGALGLVKGELSRRVESLAARVTEILVSLEATLDFPDDVDEGDSAVSRLPVVRGELVALHETLSAGPEPGWKPTVVLAGPPNAGKSTLFNSLLGWDRAIVAARPGTTRDAVDGEVELGGTRLRLFDTAGLGVAADEVEGFGMDVTRRLLERADLVVLVQELRDPRPFQAPVPRDVPLLRVATKSDLAGGAGPPRADLVVSALTGAGMNALREVLGRKLSRETAPGEFLCLARHRDAVGRACTALEEALAVRGRSSHEIVAQLLREAVTALGEVTGAVASIDLVDRVFSSFCIGK